MACWLTVIGIGEDGLNGLGETARQALASADVIFGGKRHLGLVGETSGARQIAWPSPFDDAFPMIAAERGKSVVVLASGDPMHYGMGASLTRHFSPEEMLILPYPSSFSLAAARMGWSLQDVRCLSVHGRPLEALAKHILPGVKLLILSNDASTPDKVARMLDTRGFGPSRIAVLEHLGGPKEKHSCGIAGTWTVPAGPDLNIIAVECLAEPDAKILPAVIGLPDDAFENDGQLTKRDVRAVTLSRLAPLPGEVLWDVGAGCGSIGIEWMRTHASCRAIAIEANEGRQGMIARNRDALGVPGLQIVAGEAPGVLAGLEGPDAIFIGGGVTDEGVLQACWDVLKPGGRLVANAVTLQSEMQLFVWRQRFGGELIRLSVAQAAELGSFDVWRQALPVTLYSTRKDK
jgi:precorrin-6B C5,15-methyltransferase / cobalt-precorrin-6B C5,C15-methyltransferase